MEDAASQIEVALGPIDVWVNAAMASVFSPVHELQAEEVRRVAAVTYLGSVNGILTALRRMRHRDAGTIVQVGSALAYRAIPLQASYCGSKFAIRGFVDSLRCELLHEQSGVRITTVHMPALNTPQFGWVRSRLPFHPQPVPPIYQPELAAEAIVWGAGHPRRESIGSAIRRSHPGPTGPGARTAVGKAAVLCCPQRQRQVWARCSVAIGVTSGRSTTWRAA